MMIIFRAMQLGDRPQAEALWKGVGPYCPGMKLKSEAMYQGALRARDAGDRKWKSLKYLESDDFASSRLANWVAVAPLGSVKTGSLAQCR